MKVIKKIIVPLLVLAMLIGLAPNAATGLAKKKKEKTKITSVKITNKKDIGAIFVGDSIKIKYSVKIKKGKGTISKAVKFSSSDKKVATITSKGTLTVVGEGKTKITVKSVANKKKCDTYTVTFKEKKVDEDNLESVSFATDELTFDADEESLMDLEEPYTIELGGGDSFDELYNIDYTPIDPEKKIKISDFIWSSSDEKVVKVNPAGTLTLVNFGTANIKITYKGNEDKYAEVKVNVVLTGDEDDYSDNEDDDSDDEDDYSDDEDDDSGDDDYDSGDDDDEGEDD